DAHAVAAHRAQLPRAARRHEGALRLRGRRGDRMSTIESVPEKPFPLAHHFSDPDQQLQSNKLGMWLFLATEVLLFGGLFCAYAIYRALHPDVFHNAQHFLNTNLGALNTIV